jgi:hypothetical protein
MFPKNNATNLDHLLVLPGLHLWMRNHLFLLCLLLVLLLVLPYLLLLYLRLVLLYLLQILLYLLVGRLVVNLHATGIAGTNLKKNQE